MTESNLNITREAGALRISLNRPHVLNALAPALLVELRNVLENDAQQQSIRAVLLTGEGRAFSAGADLAATRLEAGVAGLLRDLYNPVVLALSRLQKPVLAGINGVAVGAGLSLALACDLRVAASDAQFSIGFSGIGLTLDAGASFHLPRLVGSGRAFELASSNRRVDAAEAERIGLIERVLPADGFAASAWEYTQQLAAGPTHAFALMKSSLAASFHNSLEQQLEAEALAQQTAAGTADAREGISAFLARRTPEFRGS